MSPISNVTSGNAVCKSIIFNTLELIHCDTAGERMVSSKLQTIYTKSSIFRDSTVLKKGFMPESLDDVLHRDDIITKYAEYIKEVMHGEVPDNLLIYGLFGTGKTLLSRLITSEIAEAAEIAGQSVCVVYVYCLVTPATGVILRNINSIMAMRVTIPARKTGVTISANFMYFCEFVNNFDGTIIIIFDEIDKLNDPDMINQIVRIKECGFATKNVCVIGITNDLVFYDNLLPRTKSVLGQHELFIPPYNAVQLNDILQQRAKTAFNQGVLDESVIPLCSGLAAQDKGDARQAIALLRLAGESAETRKSPIVEEIDVRFAIEKIQIDRIAEIVGTLPTHQKAVLYACAQVFGKAESPIESPTIYDTYCVVCEVISLDPVSARQVNSYIAGFDENNIVSVTKTSRGRRKGVVNCVTLRLLPEKVKQLILEDYRFTELKCRIDDMIASRISNITR